MADVSMSLRKSPWNCSRQWKPPDFESGIGTAKVITWNRHVFETCWLLCGTLDSLRLAPEKRQKPLAKARPIKTLSKRSNVSYKS
jgi:hypothetical protein